MNNVIPMLGETVADLWETYHALAIAVVHDPRLRADHKHNVALVRAWKRWSVAFIAQDAA